jgi:hypothetical protein
MQGRNQEQLERLIVFQKGDLFLASSQVSWPVSSPPGLDGGGCTRWPVPNLFGQGLLIYINEKNQKKD